MCIFVWNMTFFCHFHINYQTASSSSCSSDCYSEGIIKTKNICHLQCNFWLKYFTFATSIHASYRIGKDFFFTHLIFMTQLFFHNNHWSFLWNKKIHFCPIHSRIQYFYIDETIQHSMKIWNWKIISIFFFVKLLFLHSLVFLVADSSHSIIDPLYDERCLQ